MPIEDTNTTPPAAPQPPSRGRRAVVIALRIVVTAALLFVLVRAVDWPKAWAVLRNADPAWLAAGVGTVIAARLIITARWAILLRALGERPALARLNEIVFASLSLGVLIPSAIGMDIARGVMLSLEGDPAKRAPRAVIVSSLLLDRAVATIGTLIVAVVGAAILGSVALSLGLGAATLIGCFGLVAIGTGLCGRLARRIPKVPAGIRGKIDRLFTLLATPRIIAKGVAPSLALSLGLTACRTLLFVFLYHALGEPVPTGLAFVVVPLLLVAMMIPVAIGGFGLREVVLIESFQTVGVSPEVSATVGILSFLIQHAVSLPFALRVVLARRSSAATAESAQQPAINPDRPSEATP